MTIGMEGRCSITGKEWLGELPVFVQTLLKTPRLARLATVDQQNRPHVTPVWFLLKDDEILVSVNANSAKARCVFANPEVALVIDTAERPHRGVEIGGIASLDHGNAAEVTEAIYVHYLGAAGREEARTLLATTPCVLLRVRPRRAFYWDYSKVSG